MSRAAVEPPAIPRAPAGRAASRPTLSARAPVLIGAAVVAAGAAAALHYHAAGLSLAHYDARAHLVVARRILDSLTPGWQQIGAVWLPLPHLVNMLPVQVDAWYRTGASAIVLSVASMGVAAWALARVVVSTTGSAAAAAAGAGLMMANPNVLYLQSTPMTEPVLVATSLLAVLFTADWVRAGGPLPPRRAGWALVAACLTRYEAWPLTAALIAIAALVLLRTGTRASHVVSACARLAVYPALAIVLFSANSRWTTGSWFVPSGFFVPENPAMGDAALALEQVAGSVRALSGPAWMWPAVAASVAIAVASARSARHAPLALLFALAAAAVLPWSAYVSGHPVRVRYGFPLVIACAALTAGGIGLLRAPLRAAAAAGVLAWALLSSAPFDRGAPLVVESQRERPNQEGRRAVTDYLRRHWDGTPIMMSMGSLAHYMHDLSAIGLDIRDFLQEGNEWLWVHAARVGPRGLVRWVIVEERAEGGDALARAAAADPRFFDGFARVAQGGGVALYERRENRADAPAPHPATCCGIPREPRNPAAPIRIAGAR